MIGGFGCDGKYTVQEYHYAWINLCTKALRDKS